jgi:hypothetical protein
VFGRKPVTLPESTRILVQTTGLLKERDRGREDGDLWDMGFADHDTTNERWKT